MSLYARIFCVPYIYQLFTYVKVFISVCLIVIDPQAGTLYIFEKAGCLWNYEVKALTERYCSLRVFVIVCNLLLLCERIVFKLKLGWFIIDYNVCR